MALDRRLITVMALVCVLALTTAVEVTSDDFLLEGARECGPKTTWKCQTGESMGGLIFANALRYKETGEEAYLTAMQELHGERMDIRGRWVGGGVWCEGSHST